jgi:membrane protein
MNLTLLWKLCRSSVIKWWQDDALRLGAALSYYTIFSLAPLFTIVVALVGFILGEEMVKKELVGEFADLVGPASARTIQTMIESARQPVTGVIATIVSVTVMVVVSTGMFAELQDALNLIWDIKPKASINLWTILKNRFFSFIMVIGIGFLLLASLIVSAILSGAGKFLSIVLSAPEPLMQLINEGLSFAVITLLFAMMFKVLPEAHIAWKDVWVGALVTAVLFTIGKWVIGFCIGKSVLVSIYGTASSLMIILLWVYYSSLIFFLGAELTCVHATKYESPFRRSLSRVA